MMKYSFFHFQQLRKEDFLYRVDLSDPLKNYAKNDLATEVVEDNIVTFSEFFLAS